MVPIQIEERGPCMHGGSLPHTSRALGGVWGARWRPLRWRLRDVLVGTGAEMRDNGPANAARQWPEPVFWGEGTTRSAHKWTERGVRMAAMKPRTGDGPLEVTKEGRGIVMRVPLEGGGRLVVELNAEEARALADALEGVVG